MVFIDSNIPNYVAGQDHPLLDPAGGISVRDAIHAAVMLNNGGEEIASFDTGFDLVPGVRRVILS